MKPTTFRRFRACEKLNSQLERKSSYPQSARNDEGGIRLETALGSLTMEREQLNEWIRNRRNERRPKVPHASSIHAAEIHPRNSSSASLPTKSLH